MTDTIKSMKAASEDAKIGWRSRPNGYEEMHAAFQAFLDFGEGIRKRLPFQTSVWYAYSPRENVGSGGGTHIVVEQDTTWGRIFRPKHHALCQPASKRFWGLTNTLAGDRRRVDCMKCLEMAERIVNGK